jgi:hypothetical protein
LAIEHFPFILTNSFIVMELARESNLRKVKGIEKEASRNG